MTNDPFPADPDKRLVNQEDTLAAQEKEIKKKFPSWVFADPKRTERLGRFYNDAYHNLRPRLLDEPHLDFPGMMRMIAPKSHSGAAANPIR
jgi:N12 class adenine-specific DNA methylase